MGRRGLLNEKLELTDFYGRRIILVSSTFPLEYSGELIGTMETSVFYHRTLSWMGKTGWPIRHKGAVPAGRHHYPKPEC